MKMRMLSTPERGLIFLCLIVFSSQAVAQETVELGLFLGLNTGNTNTHINLPSFQQRDLLGAQAGAFLRIPLGKQFVFQPEVNFIGRGEYYFFRDPAPDAFISEEIRVVRLNDIDIGANLQKLFGNKNLKFFLGMGSFFSYSYSGKQTMIVTRFNRKSILTNPLSFGESFTRRLNIILTALISMEFKIGQAKFQLKGRFQQGMWQSDNSFDPDQQTSPSNAQNNYNYGIRTAIILPLRLNEAKQ